MRRIAAVIAAALICALYLADLTGMGMVSADEPRYAEIGREMAATGDWITPHLWGSPWFEKPALLYWMTATAFRLGLGPDLAPRLPVALLSLAFLAFFWLWLRREWNPGIAWRATLMLATSAGWLAYSHVAVTDLPMSAFFAAAVLLAISTRPRWIASAICLAIAALAKGLVPLVLFAPVLLFRGWRRRSAGANVIEAERRSTKLLIACLAFLCVALPWYVLCTLRNGAEFPRVLFVQQTFGRFNSDTLQHAQPWWFYVPVALLLLYPWFPLLVFANRALGDARSRTLAGVVIFGFVFFSVMKNKLPGYLLPLLPEACALSAIGYMRAGRPAWATAAVISLVGILPAAARVLPEALSSGIRKSHLPAASALWLVIPAAILAGLATTRVNRGALRFAIAATINACALLWFQFAVFPAIDRTASARPLWVDSHPDCAPQLSRSLVYGLDYYAGKLLPPCEPGMIDRTGSALYGTERR